MNNLMDEYIEFTKKNLRKYMKIIFEKYYDNIVIDEYIKTYINVLYHFVSQYATKLMRLLRYEKRKISENFRYSLDIVNN